MSNSIISEGRTTNEAIEKGLKELKVSRNQVDIKILENEDKRSFFDILAPRVVKVELTVNEKLMKNKKMTENTQNSKVESDSLKKKEYKKYDDNELKIASENLKAFLDVFLKKIGEDAKYEIKEDENGIFVRIDGESTTILIGYRGETLNSLQTILTSIASKGLETRIRVILDISGYKDKREKTLQELAEKVERTVVKTRRSVTLEPMTAYERKIIHTKLQDSKMVTTSSIGEEPRRRVVISLK